MHSVVFHGTCRVQLILVSRQNIASVSAIWDIHLLLGWVWWQRNTLGLRFAIESPVLCFACIIFMGDILLSVILAGATATFVTATAPFSTAFITRAA